MAVQHLARRATLILLAIAVVGATVACNPGTTTTTTTQNPTMGDVFFVNQTGQRLRVYVNGIFISFVEIGQTISTTAPAGAVELEADNFDVGTWGPVVFNLTGGGSITWTLN